MKTASQIDTTDQFGLLIQGPPKSGKTELACLFPKPWVANADSNLVGFAKRCKEQGFVSDMQYSDIYRDDDGKEIGSKANTAEDKTKRWIRFLSECDKAIQSPDIKTIVWDSMSTMAVLATEFIPVDRVKRAGKGQNIDMEIQDWNTNQNLWRSLIMRLRSSGKMLVVTCHEEGAKDEVSGGVVKWMPNIPGTKLQASFSGFFSDVWRTEIESDKDTTKFLLRTKPTPRLDLGGSVQTKTNTLVRPTGLKEQQELIWNMIGYKP